MEAATNNPTDAKEIDATQAEAPAAASKPKKEPKAKKEAAPKPEKVPAVVQNGISRPKVGTATGSVWDIADAESTKMGAPAPRKAVLDATTAAGINAATAATQYGRWRKFHGLKGTGAEKAAAAEAAAPAAAA